MESTFGSEEDKHSLSTVIFSDLHSRLSWGLSSSLNVNEKLVIFSRYNNHAHAGQRVIFQAVSKVLRDIQFLQSVQRHWAVLLKARARNASK